MTTTTNAANGATTTITDASGQADRELKARHRAIWASGNYHAVAEEIIPDLGRRLVAALDIQHGERVLDVAAGSGNAAIPAALAGAQVTASDLTPELFEAGRRTAAAYGAHLDWEEGDAEALPYADAQFDVVMSCVGVMFAPHHQASADELLRVCRPGGRVGLISWTPEGFIGQLFAAMKPYAPPPPPGAQPPPLWGSEEHVLDLFADRLTDVAAVKQTLTVTHYERPVDFREYFKTVYGPVIATYRANASQPERTERLDAALLALAERFDRSGGDAGTVLDWEYLLVTGRKRQHGC